ncbi:MAG TPA: TVP38/TMEM64 family protein [Blastocatellia bacterium]|nr:TVP38/TMEM64 family protein [Blastocatellia bacterium]
MRHLKTILMVVVVIAISSGFLFLPVREWFGQLQGWIAQLGAVGPIVLAAIYVVATVLLAPGSLLTIMAGTLFGLWTGVLTVLMGANLGALCSFLLARTMLRRKVAQWAAASTKFAALDRAIGQAGFKMVFLSRLSPAFPFVLLNYLLGLTKVRTGAYVLANLLGMLPGTFLYVYIGAVAGEALNGAPAGSAGPYKQILTYVGLLATIGVVVLVTRAARKALAEAETADSRMPDARKIAEVQ